MGESRILNQRMGSFMKILRDTIIITFFVSGLIFARTDKDFKRVEYKNLKTNNHHYWVNDHSDNNDQLDRKRSHKRRRKIRKPVKGLR